MNFAQLSLPVLGFVFAAAAAAVWLAGTRLAGYFGTNLFNFTLIFLVDAIYSGEPVLDTAGGFEVVGAILTVLLTGIFAVGLLERRNLTVLRMGYDALAAFAAFGGGVAMLFSISRAGPA